MIDNSKVKTLIPWDQIESGAIDQIMHVCSFPEVIRCVIMPDVHQGYFLPIGGIMLTENHISPQAVGYDISCGMCYIDTKIQSQDMFPDEESKLTMYDKLNGCIPMGLGIAFEDAQADLVFKNSMCNKELDKKVYANVNKQLGSLGGGNHFIEIGITRSNTIGITIHSGSRNPGWVTADFYMNLIPRLIGMDTELGQAYFTDMNFFTNYAFLNRTLIMKNIIENIGLGRQWKQLEKTMINKTHNHAEITPEGVLHRKGATSSNKDELGVIPGNMRDGVYVVKGLGNAEYLNSSSHGAGRTMSRGAVKKLVQLEDFEESMKGIVGKVQVSTIDESPFAYKDIHSVIKMQDGIVIEVLDYVKPIINLKG